MKIGVVIFQFPVSSWYDMFQDHTYAEACLARLLSGAYRLEMNGKNMRNMEPINNFIYPEECCREFFGFCEYRHSENSVLERPLSEVNDAHFLVRRPLLIVCRAYLYRSHICLLKDFSS